jgi:hypothetical protein
MSFFRPSRDRSNRFMPQIESLEERQLLSQAVISAAPPTTFQASSLFSQEDHLLPRTGGAAFMQGSVLHVGVNLPVGNEASIQDDGRGDVTVEWNGHNPPTFHGVRQIVIDAAGRLDAIHYTLTGNVTRPEEVDVLLHSPDSTFTPILNGFQARGLTFHVETPDGSANTRSDGVVGLAIVNDLLSPRTSPAARLVGSILLSTAKVETHVADVGTTSHLIGSDTVTAGAGNDTFTAGHGADAIFDPLLNGRSASAGAGSGKVLAKGP